MAYQGSAVVYPSKRDWWIVLLLWVSVLGMVVGTVAVWSEPAPLAQRVGLTVLMALMAMFALWLLYSTRYRVELNVLVVRSGPFRWKIDLDSIEEVVPTRNPLSSPACSLDRLRIRYAGSRLGIMISPKNKMAFLRDLAARAPGLELAGDRIVRRHPG